MGMTEDINTIKSMEVAEKFNSYPNHIRQKLMFLRQLIIDTSAAQDDVTDFQETLKWGEPSYLSKTGSTIRLGWKASKPDQYAMFFHCKTKLVDTFKELYGERFQFEGNRAIVFQINDNIPIEALRHCIALSLTYHRRKKLPMLGT